VTAIIGYCNSFVVTGSETQLLRKTAGSAADVLAATSNIKQKTSKYFIFFRPHLKTVTYLCFRWWECVFTRQFRHFAVKQTREFVCSSSLI